MTTWLSMEEVKLHLDMDRDRDDEEVYGFVLAAEQLVDNLVGIVRPPVVPVTEIVHGCGQDALVLSKFPVAAVVEVRFNGTVVTQVDPEDLSAVGWFASDTDLAGGLLRHTSWW